MDELRLRNIEWGGQRFRRERNRDGNVVFEPVTQSGRNREEWRITTGYDLLIERLRTLPNSLSGEEWLAEKDRLEREVNAEMAQLFDGPMEELDDYARQLTMHAWGFERDDPQYVDSRLGELYNWMVDEAVLQTVTDCYPQEVAAIAELAEVDAVEEMELYEELYQRAVAELPFERAYGRMLSYTFMFGRIARSVSPMSATTLHIQTQIAGMREQLQTSADVSEIPPDVFVREICWTMTRLYPHLPGQRSAKNNTVPSVPRPRE